jgi:hypothetical protein
LQILAGEFPAAREAIVIAEATIAAAAPERTAAPMTMPVAPDGMP